MPIFFLNGEIFVVVTILAWELSNGNFVVSH